MNKKVLISIASVLTFIIIVMVFFILSNTKYTITFDSNGGTTVEKLEVKKNSTIETLPIISRNGYTFLYWTLDGKMFDKSTKITKNITLKATWQKLEEPTVETKKYIVTFNTDGGSKIESIEVEENKLLTKPEEPTKDGYTFDKWMLNNKEYDFDTKVTKDITLKATWKKIEENKKQYTITFNTEGGSKISSKKVVEGNKVSKPSNPTKSGYTFIEWQLDGKTYNFNSTITKDITLKAVWKKNEETPKPPVVETTKYTVNFDTKGGSSINSQTIEKGKTVSKPNDPTKEGYTFIGWTLNGSSYDFNNPVNSNITLIATWKEKEVVKTYTASITQVDAYSPDRYITIKENGTPIEVSKIMYTDGVEIIGSINGTKISVALADIVGETVFKVRLSNGSIVTAKVE